jgi:hypothetical protein
MRMLMSEPIVKIIMQELRNSPKRCSLPSISLRAIWQKKKCISGHLVHNLLKACSHVSIKNSVKTLSTLVLKHLIKHFACIKHNHVETHVNRRIKTYHLFNKDASSQKKRQVNYVAQPLMASITIHAESTEKHRALLPPL